jgi:signal transduction histidine kinase
MIMNFRPVNSTLRLGLSLALGVSLMLTVLALVSNQPVTDNTGGFFLIGAISSPLLLLGLLGLRERMRKPDTLPEAAHFDTAALLAVFEALPEGVVYSVDGAVRYANPALYELFDQPGGKKGDLKMAQRLLRGILDQHGTTQGEHRLQRLDGSEFDASLTTARVSGNGSRDALVIIIRDITLEKDILAQRTRMMSNAAHELRTPIANFKTRLYLIRRQPEKLDEHLDVLEESTEHMQHMIEDMLDVARFERGVVQLTRRDTVLQTLVQDVVNETRVRANRLSIQLTAQIPDEPLLVFVDTRRIKQLINNLVANAMNHTPQGGKIEVEVQARCSENPDYPSYAVIHVRDNGVGVTSDLLAQVFQPFEAAAQGSTVVTGTALGLSLAKEIAELHGGEITVNSELGKGSTFSVKLLLVNH